ncbi:SDR family oxidoreductase [Levilactobacillus bambusae]|uniref:Oxidoreductase n=1 Tax=Levilactobacillus bambusae TaxID=2024736 RepID=A0A2V1MZV0_9LACO|nr:SDR family oxidoreductase [Levilactobacillus bambusae]PWG00293.1 oxidoreductase [Levilactobacillus bambusae]
MKKLVVITGASSGFGAETAKIFNANGYPTLLLGRNTAKIKTLPLDFTNVLVDQVDVTNYAEFKAAVRKAEDQFGQTDLLVNNAGVMLLGNVWRQDPSEWQTMLNTNVMGVLNGMQIVLDDMMAREGGTIINMSSIAGRKEFANHAAYVATKMGVHGLSETVRGEVAAKNVRVAVVAPGAADTELLTHVTDEEALATYNDWKQSMGDGGKTLDPKYVAQVVYQMYQMPQEVNIREVVIAATKQDS